MFTNKCKILTFSALFPLLFVIATANAATLASDKAVGTIRTEQVKKSDVKATVLAKGQNNLPKRKYDETS